MQRLFWQTLTHDSLPVAECFVPAERMAIYRNMYRWRLIDALRDTFPKVAQWVGDVAFVRWAERYIAQYPSQHYSISQIGQHVVDFLRHTEQRCDLADLAALEWARALAFEAIDSVPLSVNALQTVGPAAAQASLTLAPSLLLLTLEHAVAPVWKALDAGELPPSVSTQKTFVAVWRKEYQVYHAGVSATEAKALAAARTGASIAQLCEMFSDEPNPAAAAFKTLSSWFADGWVIGLE